MITYQQSVIVRLDGRKVGKIVQVEGGWQYWPNRGPLKGEVLPTLEAVKRSLEEE